MLIGSFLSALAHAPSTNANSHSLYFEGVSWHTVKIAAPLIYRISLTIQIY